MADPDPRVLCTETQSRLHGDDFRTAAPGVRLVVLAADGSLHVDDTLVEGDDAAFDVAFASTDLFDSAGDRTLARHLFVHALRSDDLRWLHVAAAGVDDPVFGMLLDKGVRLTTSHHTATPIAEYVLAQVLRARLPLAAMDGHQAARRWHPEEWDEVASSRWLVIGLGAIGTAVATRARAFGAHVTGVRRTPRGDEPVDAMVGPDAVVGALADHDVVVLSVPATASTAGMVDAAFLDALAPGTILVNVGRGALVDEDALRSSLDRGRPATAVLDVASEEPLPSAHWLWAHPSVVLTAHTSAGGRQRVARAAAAFAANLARWSAGSDLLDEVRAEDREAPPAES